MGVARRAPGPVEAKPARFGTFLPIALRAFAWDWRFGGGEWYEVDRGGGRKSSPGSGARLFRGSYEHAVDAKGRTALPAKFREVMQGKYGGEGTLILAPSADGSPCLRAYPLQEWRATEEKLAAMDEFDPRVDELIRLYVGPSQEVETDKLGRLLVPQALREQIGIAKDVTFVGKLKHFEVWDAETFRNYVNKQRAEGTLPRGLKELAT
jgi:MraZ protein